MPFTLSIQVLPSRAHLYLHMLRLKNMANSRFKCQQACSDVNALLAAYVLILISGARASALSAARMMVLIDSGM